MSKLIVISAPSGAGKTTLCQRLLKDFPELVLSISSTTRAPRGAEKEGVDYHFISKEEFRRQIEAGRFAEWAEVHGNYYGTSKQVIEHTFALKKSVLLDIDVQGSESLRQAYPRECFTVFIAPPSLGALESRLRSRKTDSEEVIQKRVRNAREEMRRIAEFHQVVINDQLEPAYEELRILVSGQLRPDTPLKGPVKSG
jgi:guanylate kinase